MSNKIDPKERERIARESLTYSTDEEASQHLRVSKETLRRCRREVGLQRAKSLPRSPDEKMHIVKESVKYNSLKEAAQYFGVSGESIANWREQYFPGPQKAKIEELEKRYPTLINQQSPKVMSKEAEEEIREKEENSLSGVAEALGEYKGSPEYIKALSEGGPIYNIRGEIVGEVSLSDKFDALRCLRSEKLFKKIRKHRGTAGLDV